MPLSASGLQKDSKDKKKEKNKKEDKSPK